MILALSVSLYGCSFFSSPEKKPDTNTINKEDLTKKKVIKEIKKEDASELKEEKVLKEAPEVKLEDLKKVK
ncbi:hypothetical protein HZA38_02490 [Candidatus Peregrinibacteria bacterium]|nr:hypothetical protein [Candidatus Peregrinibacteria bacterium]